MRSAPVVCGALLMIAAVCVPTVRADPLSAGTGPLYTVEALRAFEMFGVHLGMRRAEAHNALAAAGLKMSFAFREGVEHDVTGEQYDVPGSGRPGSYKFFSVAYKRWPGRVLTVSGFTYDWTPAP